MANQLLQAAKHALEFIESIDGYASGKTANELRSAIEAAEQSVQPTLPTGDGVACPFCGEVDYCIHRDD
ncbi:MAG TPA: hypothetical protein PKC99_06020 [Anaerolineales bacterium]|nr:hypothetical protein [Anaerolineales bacterium]